MTEPDAQADSPPLGDAHWLAPLIRPRSIAIAGASSDPGKLGSLPLQFLRKFDYDGAIYPINARAPEVHGVRAHPSLAGIAAPIDLLVVAIAAERVPELLDECAPGQVRFALVLSSNYAETGEEGARHQRQLLDLATRKKIRLVGPNSVGLVNLFDRTVASISQVFDQRQLEPGPVALVSQSGAVGTAITALAHAQGIGIGHFVSTGNEADLEFSDFCDYFVDDPRVAVIAGYVESVRDGAKFRRVASRALKAGKPILLVKVGTTGVGGRAVRSHTGALAGADDVYRSVFAAHGIVRADGIESLLDALRLFVAYPPADPAPGARVAVLSHSGGAGVMMADAAVTLGLDMPPPSPALRQELEARLPRYAALDNPVDMTANVIFKPDVIAETLLDVVDDGEYDAALLCVNLIWRQGEALADALLAARARTRRMLAVAWLAGPEAAIQRLALGGVPVFGDPLRCVRAVAARLGYDAARRADAEDRVPAGCIASSVASVPLRYADRLALLARYGIPVVPGRLASGHGDARQAAAELGYPVAAKLISPTLLHKSDAGGVVLGIENEDDLVRAVDRLLAIPCVDREGILIQPMIGERDGIELFTGFMQDPVFGPIVAFGLGGLFVEALREVAMRPAPFGPETAAAMIRGTRFYPLLAGYRGRPPCDLHALAELCSHVSLLAACEPSLRALDLNPVLASPRGALALDFKFDLAPMGETGAAA